MAEFVQCVNAETFIAQQQIPQSQNDFALFQINRLPEQTALMVGPALTHLFTIGVKDMDRACHAWIE